MTIWPKASPNSPTLIDNSTDFNNLLLLLFRLTQNPPAKPGDFVLKNLFFTCYRRSSRWDNSSCRSRGNNKESRQGIAAYKHYRSNSTHSCSHSSQNSRNSRIHSRGRSRSSRYNRSRYCSHSPNHIHSYFYSFGASFDDFYIVPYEKKPQIVTKSADFPYPLLTLYTLYTVTVAKTMIAPGRATGLINSP